MKTRNASAAAKKKTPPARKTAAKAQPTPSSVEKAPPQSPPTETAPPKPGPATRGKHVKSTDIIRTAVPDVKPPPERAPAPAPTDPKAIDDAVATQETSETKPTKTTRRVVKRTTSEPLSNMAGSARRVVKRVIKKTVIRSVKNPKPGETAKVEESIKDNDMVEAADQKPLVKDLETIKNDEIGVFDTEYPAITEVPRVKNVEGDHEVNLNMLRVEETTGKQEVEGKAEESSMECVTKSPQEQEPAATESKPLEDQEVPIGKEKEELVEQFEEQMKTTEVETMCSEADMDDHPNEEKTDFDDLLEDADDEKIEGIADQEIHIELDQEQCPKDDEQEQGEEVLEDGHTELNAAAKERKLRKELEIFVGGLDRDVTEEDLKKAFQNAGEVVDVRLHRDPSTNKNKGYAFVRFANKEQVSRALSEMKNPVICGKRCGTAAREDNDSLFVGNICNTWTKEAIKQKLKDYGIEGVEKITLVADPKHEGLSRGFAFLEFSCHAEAMLAFKRLQKPDAIFGHPERTVKVAFAEPLREPNPDVMAQVKSVFVDGLPPQWDEDCVKEKFKRFGEITNIVLARNMSTAKRKDFGFVDFTTHEAAVACIESVNSTELVDGNSKVKVRARLSNPLPKTQAVKGGMAGGFRIARGSGGTHPGFGRGFGQGGRAFNHLNFQRDRGFYPHGPGQSGEMGFANEHELDSVNAFHGRHNSERAGGRWGVRGAHQGSIGGPLPIRPNFDRFRRGGRGDYDPMRRESFPQGGGFNRPYPGRHINDRHSYDDPAHGTKRPYSMRDQDPGYLEPSTRRRFEYSDASASFHGNRYQDTFGADGGRFQQDYYGSDYDVAYPPFYGGYRLYGRGYYY